MDILRQCLYQRIEVSGDGAGGEVTGMWVVGFQGNMGGVNPTEFVGSFVIFRNLNQSNAGLIGREGRLV